MNSKKKQMEEIAVLYYKKNYTQQEIANLMNLSRQTVSKLLNEAIEKNVVEIKIHNSEADCGEMEKKLCEIFKIKQAVVCGVDSTNDSIRQLMTARKTKEYLLPIIKNGNQKIAISWGRTVQSVIAEFSEELTSDNIVFPLFGATDTEQPYYLSNEFARSFADRINATVKYAWFPYKPDNEDDCNLFRKTSYYKNIQEMWNNIDIAIVGIGNKETLEYFSKIFNSNHANSVVGDISTHFFSLDGEIMNLYNNTLCASVDNLKKARQVVAIACGDSKEEAIIGALKTQIVDTFITDEYTAKKILRNYK